VNFSTFLSISLVFDTSPPQIYLSVRDHGLPFCGAIFWRGEVLPWEGKRWNFGPILWG
jgi:hypothetical protein